MDSKQRKVETIYCLYPSDEALKYAKFIRQQGLDDPLIVVRLDGARRVIVDKELEVIFVEQGKETT